jgi:hypothetical protein
MDVDKLKRAMRSKRGEGNSGMLLLSTGSTLLNLAMTGNAEGGWIAGHYFLFVGDSDSGKSWFVHTALAEASINSAFKDYRLIYDNTEAKSLMDIARFFGDRLAKRIEAPRTEGGEPVFSNTVEDMYYNVDDALEGSRPFIYILDSQDTLTSKREAKKFEQLKGKSRGRKSDVSDGDYSDGKAKVHSSHLRRLITPLAKKQSLLIIVNQSRDSFNMFEQGTYSGGRALKFYAVCQLWSGNVGKIQKTFRGKKRQLGIQSKVSIRKNHITGKQSDVVVPIYHSHGIDDIGSCIDWLVGESIWKKSNSGVIKVTGMGPVFEGKKEKLIRKIEDENLEPDLQDMMQSAWDDIEAATAIKRKPKYT